MKYLFDTEAFVWMLSSDDRFPLDIWNDIHSDKGNTSVCNISLLEVSQLQCLKKIKLDKDIIQIEAFMREHKVGLHILDGKTLEKMKSMPILRSNKKGWHTDPFDRYIIATAIRTKSTLVSSDGDFPQYREYGLELLEL